MRISVTAAKNRLPELIKAVERGELVTICRRGVPIVDLVPTKYSNRDKPIFGALASSTKEIDPDWWKPMSDEEVDKHM